MRKAFDIPADTLTTGLPATGFMRFGALVEIDPSWGSSEEVWLCFKARQGDGPIHGIAVGTRSDPKSPDEKPGVRIQIDDVPLEKRAHVEMLVRRTLGVNRVTFY